MRPVPRGRPPEPASPTGYGVTVAALERVTLCGEILTAVVIDDAVFDRVFAELV